MEIKTNKGTNYTSLHLVEEKLDFHNAQHLKSELILIAGNGEKNIIVDFGKCKYCDSTGLSAILVAKRLCKNANGILVLTGLNDTIRNLLRTSQLDSVLNISDSIEDAIKVIQSKGK